jgi:hypothetical protein
MTPKEKKIYKIYVLFEVFWDGGFFGSAIDKKNGIVAQPKILIIKNQCPNLDL